MARFFLDEDVSHLVAEELRQLGYDVLTVAEAGRKGLDDGAQLTFATNVDRIVVTHNRRHFLRLHYIVASHAGIIICTKDDANPIGLAKRIDKAIVATISFANRLLRINRPAAAP